MYNIDNLQLTEFHNYNGSGRNLSISVTDKFIASDSDDVKEARKEYNQQTTGSQGKRHAFHRILTREIYKASSISKDGVNKEYITC